MALPVGSLGTSMLVLGLHIGGPLYEVLPTLSLILGIMVGVSFVATRILRKVL